MNPRYIILFLTILQYVNSCYITNCPWGGKRSLNSFTSESSSHECPICANGLGLCFGPNICCGEGLGCLIGTKETNACKLENKLNFPCTTYGKSCSTVKYGKCATESLCCNPDYCVPDKSCKSNESEASSSLDESETIPNKTLLRLMLKLLKSKQHELLNE